MEHFNPLDAMAKQSSPDPHDGGGLIAPAGSGEHHLTQAQAASMRRKKNADAQAAFRARRANYIASLEETVTSLEAVVLSLQDTCREARTDAEELRHENAKLGNQMDALKQAVRERDKEWREWWHAKQQALGLDVNMGDCPPARASPGAAEAPQRPYFNAAPTSAAASSAANPYPNTHVHSHHHGLKESDPRSGFALQAFPESAWASGPFSNARTPCAGDPHSSEASDSPPSAGVPYGSSRYGSSGEDQHQHQQRLSSSLQMSVPYRSSPASTPSLVSEGLYAPFGETNLGEYGGGERYGRPRRAYSGPGREMYAPDSALGEVRPRRHTSASLVPGPSPPATPPPASSSSGAGPRREDEEGGRDAPMSNTLAVIKAQAFGSLRRTRTRGKKTSDTASKVAMDILAARGIGMGVPSGRKREGDGSMLH